MSYATDATGARHDLRRERSRVVSLVPSTTETVWAIGGGTQLVGVTRYCVRPPEARQRCRVVGGTKSPRVDDIVDLGPDLVLANREENRRVDIEALLPAVPVFVCFPRDVASAVEDIRVVGRLLGRRERASSLASEIEAAWGSVDGREPFRYLYFIWKNPYMVAGRGTFVEALLAEIGGVNAAPEGARYPEMTADQIAAAGADVSLLSSEPFPFTEEHARETEAELDAPRLVVDGQLLSWHGARLLEAFPYLSSLATAIARARKR